MLERGLGQFRASGAAVSPSVLRTTLPGCGVVIIIIIAWDPEPLGHLLTMQSHTRTHTRSHGRFPNSYARICTCVHAHMPTHSYTIVIFCTTRVATECTHVYMYAHTHTRR